MDRHAARAEAHQLMRLAAALALMFTCGTAHAQVIDTLALRAHTAVLAHDSMAGRGTGTPGARAAARYIAGELDRIGLRAPAPGFLQPVPLRAATFGNATSLVVRAGTRAERFTHGRDFAVVVGGRRSLRDASGNAVLVGSADQAVRAADTGIAGAAIVVLGTLGDHAGPLFRRWTAAGAQAVVLLIPDDDAFRSYAEQFASRPFYVDADVDEPHWQPDLPVVLAGRAVAEALLDAIALPLAMSDADAFEPLPLRSSVDLSLDVSTSEAEAHNVAGILEGSDPARRDEVVVFTAHYDHLGIGPAEDGDSIYNGFSDNAAGVAMLLAIARAMHDAPPARSVLFLFLTGEEKGLLGSAYYAAAPLVPLVRTVAAINLDAGAPPVPPVSWRFAGDTTTALSRTAARIAQARGWSVVRGPPRANSDHWPFSARGVPAIFVVPGPTWENTSDAERDRLRERWDHYHRAADHWHAEFPFAGLARYAELAMLIGREIADGNNE